MPLQCPHCKEPVPTKRRIFGSHIWAKWNCDRCGSRLAFDLIRRVIISLGFGVIALPLLLIPQFAMGLLKTRAGVLAFAAYALGLGPLLMLVWWRFEKIVVLEAKGVYCRQCGYDLTGDQSGQCPECGSKLPIAQEVPS